MTKLATVQSRCSADTSALRRMYEYYVQIPEFFYKQTYLELIRWLLDRVEPAHTLGVPVVRTALDTGSSAEAGYGSLYLGPTSAEDHIEFDKLASMTERDLVGLPSYPGLTPVGLWMPTNEGESGRNDEWRVPFPDISLPSVLFPIDEEADFSLGDRILGIELSPIPPAPDAPQRWRVHCSGVLCAEKYQIPNPSHVDMNVRRGVELIAVDQRFVSDEALPGDPGDIFNFGVDTPAAFLIAFRVTALPPAPVFPATFSSVLLRGQDELGNYYLLGLDDLGVVRLVVGDGAGETASLPLSTGLQVGEWACALAVIKPSNPAEPSSPNARLKLCVAGQEMVEMTGVDWAMSTAPAATATFALGDPAGAASALAHTAYLAAWMGPNALDMGDKELRRFWTALNEAYILNFNVTPEDDPDHLADQASWPVGGSPEVTTAHPDPGTLAAKYNRGQFPYVALGRFYDGEGAVRDVRGFGCNRLIGNRAPDTESLRTGTGFSWEYENCTLVEALVPSPEDLTNARRITGMSGEEANVGAVFQMSLDQMEKIGGVDHYYGFVTVSCWVRAIDDDDPETAYGKCKLLLEDAGSPSAPEIIRLDWLNSVFPESYEFDRKWRRVTAVFEVRTTATPATVTLRGRIAAEATTQSDWGLWGFQFTDEPVLSPYAPNHRTWTDPGETAPAFGPATLLRFDENRFPGFQDRGFVSLRIKLEEILSEMRDATTYTLLDAYSENGADGFDRAALEIERPAATLPEPGTDTVRKDPKLVFSLRFWDPVKAEYWTDFVEIDPLVWFDETEGVHKGWWDPRIEHRIAVAWDLLRPVAGTRRHIALWVDGVLATTYFTDEPEDPMDRSILLRHLAIGASYAHFIETLVPDQLQPCAVFREVELFSRHHPGLFTPTRLEVREAEEAGESA